MLSVAYYLSPLAVLSLGPLTFLVAIPVGFYWKGWF